MELEKNYYIVEVKHSHVDWGRYRNPTNRAIILGESYIKIPSKYAKNFEILRGNMYMAHFVNGFSDMQIKASGNGPLQNGKQYAKQFEGIGSGACKAFTLWYKKSNIKVGDKIKVEFISSNDILFSKQE